MSNIDNSDKFQYIFKYSVENEVLPILWIDEEGLIIYHNKCVVNYFGSENLINTYIYRISSDIMKNDWIFLWNKLKENKNHKFFHEFYNKKLDKVFTFNVLTSLIEYDNSFYCHMVVVDITELMQTNMRLEKEKVRAEESERLKNAFLSNISHEIRTPMNAIVGFSDLLNDKIDVILKDYTNIIMINVEYLLSLIDNIILISRIDSEQIKIKYSTFDLLDLYKDLISSYNSNLIKINKDINIKLDNTESKIIETDKYILEQCFHMLLDNAIKFSKKGDVHIGYITHNKQITLYVKDNGIGIENKHHEIIFDRFRQIDKQTIGSGLGLSIFKSLINILGAKYDLVSKLNEGTMISFTMGLRSDDKDKILSNNEYNVEYLKGKNILVAEDLEINQLLIHDILLPYNVNIIKCMDGRECIDKFFETSNVDIILMDLDMPYLDGYEAAKIIRQKDTKIPIIAQTAYSQKENRERATRIGFIDFITKPITRDSLLKIILKNLK